MEYKRNESKVSKSKDIRMQGNKEYKLLDEVEVENRSSGEKKKDKL